MKHFHKPLISLILAATLLSLLGISRSSANWIGVTTAADENGGNPNACSLREAIIAANTDAPYGGCPAGAGDDAIFLGPGTYTLTIEVHNNTADAADSGFIGDLDISGSVAIVGSGVEQTIIASSQGLTKTRVFHIYGRNIKVTFQDLTIKGGNAYYEPVDPEEPDYAAHGGGILNEWGNLTLSRVTVTGNTASHSGGGIFNDFGSLYLVDSTISDNTAGYDGGGILNEAPMTISRSLIMNNAAQIRDGGGLYINNKAQVTATTITKNRTGSGRGSAIYAAQEMVLKNNTIAYNTSPQNRYALEVTAGTAILMNNIVAYNTYSGSVPANCNVVAPATVRGSYNLRDANDPCPSVGSIFITRTNISLSQNLALNGGPTLNYVLNNPDGAGGDPDNLYQDPYTGILYSCSGADQRLGLRPYNGICEAGAVEYYPEGVPLPPLPKVYLPTVLR